MALPVFWVHYYDSAWQALATVFIHAICTVIIFCLLIHTIYYFWIFNLTNRNNLKLSRRNSFSVRKGRVQCTLNAKSSEQNKLKPTNCIKIKSNLDRKLNQQIQIATSIKILTLLYIILSLLYSAISFILRFMMIFFDSKINCLIREQTLSIALVARIVLFIIFSIRLNLSFKGTVFAYNAKLLFTFTIFAILITNSTLIYFFTTVTSNRSNSDIEYYHCSKPGFSTTTPALPYICCDITFNAILVILFCRRLTRSVHMILSTNAINNTNKSILKTAKLITKLSILTIAAFVSTILIVILLGNYLLSACISIDNCVNIVCVLICFSFNIANYNRLCCWLNTLCLKFCAYLLETNIERTMQRQQSKHVSADDSISDEHNVDKHNVIDINKEIQVSPVNNISNMQ